MLQKKMTKRDNDFFNSGIASEKELWQEKVGELRKEVQLCLIHVPFIPIVTLETMLDRIFKEPVKKPEKKGGSRG